MLTKINDETWLDMEKVIRFARDGEEFKYTLDYKDRMVTYCVDGETGKQIINALKLKDQEKLQEKLREVERFIEQITTNQNGDSA